jgi:hypothetical protein
MRALSLGAVEGVAQVEEPGERSRVPGTRGAAPSLHGFTQRENPTKASTATLRTIVAIAATSTMESPLRSIAMMRYWAASGQPL